MIRGSQKGGVGGGGPTFGKNSQIISFFLFGSVPYFGHCHPSIMCAEGSKMALLGPKMAEHGRLANAPKWSKRAQNDPK